MNVCRAPIAAVLICFLSAGAFALSRDHSSGDHLSRDHAPGHNSFVIDLGAIHLRSGDSDIEVHVPLDHFKASESAILDWIRNGAKAVNNVYGHFPVKHVVIEIVARADGDHIGGTEYDGRMIRMRLGTQVTAAQLADDWTMTHEMLHLAFPDMGDQHKWMNEGLSVYMEPVARARIGIVSPKQYWKEIIEGMEQNGQPKPGDKGLDLTHSWGRTYWGGTIFWFMVDYNIRKQTNGAKSIDDVLKTILAAGGDGSQDWPMSRVLDMGDKATGTHVMHDLYKQLVQRAGRVDFAPYWKQLGVIYKDGNVTFDDKAPQAWMRKAMTAPDGKGTPTATGHASGKK